jgi:gamma-tubulin complex component 2
MPQQTSDSEEDNDQVSGETKLPPTVEELEPVLVEDDDDEGHKGWTANDSHAAATTHLHYGDRIRILCHTETPWSIVRESSPESKVTKAIAVPVTSATMAAFTVQRPRPTAQHDPCLRYGDVVSLHHADGSIMSVHRQQSEKGHNIAYVPAWIDPVETDDERMEVWKLLRAVRNGLVRVGHSAIEKVTPRSGRTAPINSGDAILFRHEKTGGILRLDVSGHLEVATDSYVPSNSNIRQRRTLLTRLQTHDILEISKHETFHVITGTVPPTPLWTNGPADTQRSFSNGIHILDAQRHASTQVEEALFVDVDKKRKIELADHIGILQANRTKQMDTPLGQEMVLIDELLGSFVGLEGNSIRVHGAKSLDDDSFRFEVGTCTNLDEGLRSMVESLLPLSTAFVRVNHFVVSTLPRYEMGLVMHAFCEALDELLQNYVALTATLEREYRSLIDYSFGISKLQTHILSALHTMSVLHHAVETVRHSKGGALINSLQEYKDNRCDGDPAAESMMHNLVERASIPYMNMLLQWLNNGILDDPYSEFMVMWDKSKLWNEQYAVVEAHVLSRHFGSRQLIERTVSTGQYWNAVRRCQGHVQESAVLVDTLPLRYSDPIVSFASSVQLQYHKASRVLVSLLLNEYDLLGSLRLMKRYFLLDHGDFFVHFLDVAERELRKSLSSVSPGRIQHWLKMSIQLSESHTEDQAASPFFQTRGNRSLNGNSIRCNFAPESLADQLDQLHAATGGIDTHEPNTPQRHAYGASLDEGLTGLDAFLIELSFVPFPVSVVLSRRALTSYQLLFRHLFLTKHAERRLVGIWKDHQTMKELQQIRGSMGPAFLLRQRMLHFLQNLMYYMMFEVIEPNWSELENEIDSLKQQREYTVDDMLQVHSEFLQSTIQACLLTSRELIRALTRLLKTCLLFSDQMGHFIRATQINEDRDAVATEKQKVVERSLNGRDRVGVSNSEKRLRHTLEEARRERAERVNRQTLRVKREVANESYRRMIVRFEEVFSEHLKEFMVRLSSADDSYPTNAQLANLCVRLDYNGYVSKIIVRSP